MVALVTVFFMPELIELIGTRILVNSSFVKKVFWNAMENREKTGEKRGDFIDSLLQLKHGKQNPNYKTWHFREKLFRQELSDFKRKIL
ncbi:cytochrome p450 6k1 [Lasius niger]|uniref:Cytochrome p450 6k1 n=1 Tax=Lasius niger TaxID=67767 RepID=A0A0J7JYA2_LASNI|nr:cytochrome p450 6k1 [Lasius niger]